MKASEVISRLEALIKEHGDKEFNLYSDIEVEFVESYEIRARVPGDFDRRITDDIFFGITSWEIGDDYRCVKASSKNDL